MSWIWLFFASMSVVGGLLYNVGTKLGGANVNALGFMFAMEVIATLLLGFCCLAAQYGFNVDVTRGLNAHAVRYAVITASGAAVINIALILAFRYGSAVSTQVFWSIGGMVAFTIFAISFFGEALTLTKALGIAFGIVSVLLITKAS
jgi:uncharacterized membrane protein